VCYAGVYSQFGAWDVFMISAMVGSGSQGGAGDNVTVQLLAANPANNSGGFGPAYHGPGTYTFNYTGDDALGLGVPDGVLIAGGVDLSQTFVMWEGTITVASDGTSATIQGTYGELAGPGLWSTEGQISGTVTCPPGAPS
jgi:hypothetical protein